MNIIRKQFLIVSGLISLTTIFLLAMLYFIVPFYYNQVKIEEINQNYTKVVEGLEGLDSKQILKKIKEDDEKFPNLYFNLLDLEGHYLYPEKLDLSAEDPRLMDIYFDQVGVWGVIVTSSDGQQLVVQGQYAFQSLNEMSYVFVTFYPFLFLTILFLSGLIGYIYSRLANKRITAISQTTREMQGLEPGLACQVKGQDEISQLATDINSLYRQLISSIEDLKEENERTTLREKKKMEFLRITSHELKTPFASLIGLVDGMIHNVGDFKDRDTYLVKCREILQEQVNLVQAILDTSNAEDIGENLTKEYFQLDQLLQVEVSSYQVLAKVKNLQLSADLQPLQVHANKTYLLKAIKNILDNALRYTKENGGIRILLGQGKLIIENQAIHPLQPDELEQVFQAFYRPDFSRNRKDGGTGLGLYMVQQILDKHHFPFSFETINQSWMRFTICFSEEKNN